MADLLCGCSLEIELLARIRALALFPPYRTTGNRVGVSGNATGGYRPNIVSPSCIQ
ncbi:MAG: hypothetical protein QOK44_380 [Betaproteobacteria bacterium]|nr:hypothetical protein [Betaproteobacteria bacterium]